MEAATTPVQRPKNARLLVVDRWGKIEHRARSAMVGLLRRGDCVIANDAATLPASLSGVLERTGACVELRLAGRSSLEPDDVRDFRCVVFGDGDFRTPTEARAAPPALTLGERIVFGALIATVVRLLDHPRLVEIRFEGEPVRIWHELAVHGKPIQYSYMVDPLAMWDVWTPIAAHPVAFEPPSAGFALDWHLLHALREKGVAFATLTHAAGLSTTGDPALDAKLPFDECYRIPAATAALVEATRKRRGRIVAIGTTVVRALEAAASADGTVQAGDGIARQHIGPRTELKVVDAIVTGTHEPDSSHYALLGAFTDELTLQRAEAALEASQYRTHEFGDSMWVERHCSRRSTPCIASRLDGTHDRRHILVAVP
ncbi:S-adenosylmethionine:tRNA ribosyltransferase-isomerase [Trinickia sp. EG282A]|uniref:S-adenosylmethionine:tRNA ribosyltransferase-isomerase n=1 Tax=Trinickia sp. EG282A TaxID=3237013 RepID=UPI0034D26D8E